MELIKKEFTFGETKGFYPVLEGIYNNNPMLRNIVEQKCETKFKKMPMVNKVADDTLIQQMLQYLDQFAPEFLPVFEYYKKSLPVNTGEMLRRKLSPGISLRLAPLPLLLQKAIDQFNLSYAANYAAPNGQTAAVYSLRILEGLLVGDDPFIYPPNGIYITEGGATNGIYTAFEYIRRKFPGSEILICGPGYFQFFENAKYDLKAKVLINPDAQNDGEVKFLPSPKQIEKSVFQYGDGKFYVGGTTKALIITQPNNPTGEFYCKKDLEEIVQIAIDNNLMIIDDAAFEELVFPSERDSFCSVSKVAYDMGALDRVITIKSFSKGKNLPGERLGYLASANNEFIEFLENSMLKQRDCPSNMNTGMICLDSTLRYVEMQMQKGVSMENAFNNASMYFNTIIRAIALPINYQLCEIYMKQRELDMTNYIDSFEYIKNLISNSDQIIGLTRSRSAYNTFVKLKELPNNLSIFEYAINLFSEFGLETQWGPNFFNDANGWKNLYGNWMRITFSSDKEYLQDSLDRIKISFDEFSKKNNKLYRTDLFR